MTLKNLLGISLDTVQPDAASLDKLLSAVQRNIADAQLPGLSAENRFDAAYKAVMQCALSAMLAKGYRPSTSEPGHHQTMIQSLPLTLGVGNEVWVLLDAMRRQRNASDYTGAPITPDMVRDCVAQATALRTRLRADLALHHANLLRPAD